MALRNSSGVGKGIDKSVVQSGRNPNQIWRLFAMPLRENLIHTPVTGGTGVADNPFRSTANSDVQKLPATLYHRIADSLAYAA